MRELIKAIMAGQPIYSAEGYEVHVVSIKNGKATVQRTEDGNIKQAKVRLDRLYLEPLPEK